MRHTIPRTAAFAWSPSTFAIASGDNATTSHVDALFALPLLVSGTASGALDASFSAEAKLEIWAPFGEQGLAAKGAISVGSRFNRLVWGAVSDTRPRGVIAAGMDNGEVDLWDPVKIIEGKGPEECLIHKLANHTGPVRGLDFNPLQSNLLASGANRGEIFIWDLNNLPKPFAPPASRSLDDITSVAWNRVVPSVLAASSTNGYTVVWDIRVANGQNGREVSALSYSVASRIAVQGQAATQPYTNTWMGPPSGRIGGVSTVVWHPANATKLAVASEDDASPVIMVWDLRNARAPERILQSHEKGILGLAWCSRDSDMLVSCGKDCRTICWNPQTGNLIAELAPGSNWAFQTDWCPRNPDLIATASFDGRIAIDSLQSTRDEPELPAQFVNGQPADGSDIFGDQGILAINNARAAVSLKQAPKWLKVPASAAFGFGGKIITISHHSIPQNPPQPGEPAPPPILAPIMKIRQTVSQPRFVESALRLEQATEDQSLQSLCDKRASLSTDATSWKLLAALFKANTRDELVKLLGFSKEEIQSNLDPQIAELKANQRTSMSRSASEAVVFKNLSLTDTPRPETDALDLIGLSTSPSGDGETPREGPLSDASITAPSDSTRAVEAESEVTEPSLFEDEGPPTTNQPPPDFFQSLGNARLSAVPDHILDRARPDASSVGATNGSASSVISEILENKSFKIYPADEAKGDRLLTRALVLGDFESAVTLCLSTDRFADALLLAVRGGPDLLKKTQKAYFQRQTTRLPYLRLYQSIVLDDLADVVQNADLTEWSEIFVVLCTFAKPGEFSDLAEQLGQRLESQYSSSSEKTDVMEHRKNATLCYLAAGRLEKVVSVWNEELKEDEQERLKASESTKGQSKESVRAEALVTFIEKVLVFQAATRYVDADLNNSIASTESPSGDKSYKLATLYDRYDEYAQYLAAQGLITSAVRYASRIPTEYPTSPYCSQIRTRISTATNKQPAPAAPSVEKVPQATSTFPTQDSVYAPNAPSTQAAYNPPTNLYGPTSYGNQPPYGATSQVSLYGHQVSAQANTYSQPPNPYTPAYKTPMTAQGASAYLPAPPPPIGAITPPTGDRVTGPPSKPETVGWNDAPLISRKFAGSAAGHRQAIVSPFPNTTATSPGYAPPPVGVPQGVAPPPRAGAAGTRTPAQTVPPPPRAGQQLGGPPPIGQPSYRPTNVGPGQGDSAYTQLGPQAAYQAGAPEASQYAPQPAQGPYAAPVHPGPYAPPPGVGRGQGQGPPPPGQRMPMPMQDAGRSGGFAPPPGTQPRAAPTPSPTPTKAEPPKPKYPPGDRTHIPASSRPLFETFSRQLAVLRQQIQPAQKKMADDTERRLNILFDMLNCETIEKTIVDGLLEISQAMDAGNGQLALQHHLALLTAGLGGDSLTVFMPAIKMLIINTR